MFSCCPSVCECVRTVHVRPFNGPLSGTIRVSRYQKGKTNLDFTEARDSEWQWHQLGYMQVCTSLQTDNHVSTPLLSFLQAGCPSCRLTNSVKALKALLSTTSLKCTLTFSIHRIKCNRLVVQYTAILEVIKVTFNNFRHFHSLFYVFSYSW